MYTVRSSSPPYYHSSGYPLMHGPSYWQLSVEWSVHRRVTASHSLTILIRYQLMTIYLQMGWHAGNCQHGGPELYIKWEIVKKIKKGITSHHYKMSHLITASVLQPMSAITQSHSFSHPLATHTHIVHIPIHLHLTLSIIAVFHSQC